MNNFNTKPNVKEEMKRRPTSSYDNDCDDGDGVTERRDSKPSAMDSAGSPSPAQRGQPVVYPLFPRLASALFYAVCGTLIFMANKTVLTVYRFPSFLALGLGQIVLTVALLAVLRVLGQVQFPSPHLSIFKKVWPLPLVFLGSIVFSLGGTKKLSIPMYVVLRRFSNLFIMLAEYFILGQKASWFVQFTVYLMILGAIVAASHDLAFDLEGYVFLLATNVCAALSGVYTKKKLNNNMLTTNALMFYNSLIMMLPLCLIAHFTGDLDKALDFGQWRDPVFVVLFVLASVMGFLINLSTLLSTKYNSVLTTSIVGVLKNVIVVYSGMIIGGDYVYSVVNFIGINMSMVGGLMYAFATFIAKSGLSSSSSDSSKA